MHLLAGCKAALCLLLLIGCSASPVRPPIDTLSHAFDGHDDNFWHAFLNFEEDQPPVHTANDAHMVDPPTDEVSRILDETGNDFSWKTVHDRMTGSRPGQTANEAAPFASSLGQPPQLRGGVAWSGQGQSAASSSYNAGIHAQGNPGLLDGMAAPHAVSGYASVPRQGSASYRPSTADRSGGYPGHFVPSHSAPQTQGAGQHGYRYAGQPTFEYRVRPDRSLVENPASHVQLGYGQQPSSSARFQQPTFQHGYGYNQGPPIQQPAGHVSLTQPRDPLEHRRLLQALSTAQYVLGDLLDREHEKKLVRLRTTDEPAKKEQVTATFYASPGVTAQLHALLQMRLDLLFPGRGEEVKKVTATGKERSIYYTIRDQRSQLYKSLDSELGEGQSEVQPVEKEGVLTSHFRAGRWIVMTTHSNRKTTELRSDGRARIRVSALLPKSLADKTRSGRPTVLYIGEYEVPKEAAPRTRVKAKPDREKGVPGPATSTDPSGPPSDLHA